MTFISLRILLGLLFQTLIICQQCSIGGGLHVACNVVGDLKIESLVVNTSPATGVTVGTHRTSDNEVYAVSKTEGLQGDQMLVGVVSTVDNVKMIISSKLSGQSGNYSFSEPIVYSTNVNSSSSSSSSDLVTFSFESSVITCQLKNQILILATKEEPFYSNSVRNRTGVIQVIQADTSAVLGYVSKDLFFGCSEFRREAGNPVVVSFLYDSRLPTASFQLSIMSVPDCGTSTYFPYLGLIQGFASTSSDLGPGSYNYVYFGMTDPTPSGSSPQVVSNSFTTYTGITETAESVVWTIDNLNNLTPQWINTDGSKPTGYVVESPGDNLLLMTGDPVALDAAFGTSFVGVRFVFIES